MVSWIYTYLQLIKWYTQSTYSFLYVNHTSTKWFLKKHIVFHFNRHHFLLQKSDREWKRDMCISYQLRGWPGQVLWWEEKGQYNIFISLWKVDEVLQSSGRCQRLFAIPWTVGFQASLSIEEFSRQEYWSGLPFPSPGALSDPGIEPGLLHCRQILHRLNHQGSL